jgi:hypothetical protein
MKGYLSKLVISMLLNTLLIWWVQVAAAKPIFVGTKPQNSICYDKAKALSLSYMTADQMAEKIRSLTGFYQPGFDEFGDIIGRLDPRTGIRSNDRPTVMSVLVLEQLAHEVAQSVLAREEFLDAEDRVVFRHLDLDQSPDDTSLSQFTRELCSSWLAQRCPSDIASELIADFRAAESRAGGSQQAWTQLVGSLLQNGTIYYY